MNKVILIGRLTRDPEVRYFTDSKGQQQPVARFTLAVDRRKGNNDQQTADFISCTAFYKMGEFFEKYAKQGTKFAVCGRLVTGSYTNKQGQKVYTTEVNVETAEFAESKKEQTTSTPDPDGFINIPDGVDDAGLPFN